MSVLSCGAAPTGCLLKDLLGRRVAFRHAWQGLRPKGPSWTGRGDATTPPPSPGLSAIPHLSAASKQSQPQGAARGKKSSLPPRTRTCANARELPSSVAEPLAKRLGFPLFSLPLRRLLSRQIQSLFSPVHLSPALRSLRGVLFPNNAPGTPSLFPPSSDAELRALRRRAASSSGPRPEGRGQSVPLRTPGLLLAAHARWAFFVWPWPWRQARQGRGRHGRRGGGPAHGPRRRLLQQAPPVQRPRADPLEADARAQREGRRGAVGRAVGVDWRLRMRRTERPRLERDAHATVFDDDESAEIPLPCT
ncbi:hypothetical protein ACCO45_001666 [Purpureocillium lilacinum]|uniref:Uncharacterized protein n=1 Tax=Purpureocillium lilacinum TaxID=33203 RepID=A0ACC4E8V3_PURLI